VSFLSGRGTFTYENRFPAPSEINDGCSQRLTFQTPYPAPFFLNTPFLYCPLLTSAQPESTPSDKLGDMLSQFSFSQGRGLPMGAFPIRMIYYWFSFLNSPLKETFLMFPCSCSPKRFAPVPSSMLGLKDSPRCTNEL